MERELDFLYSENLQMPYSSLQEKRWLEVADELNGFAHHCTMDPTDWSDYFLSMRIQVEEKLKRASTNVVKLSPMDRSIIHIFKMQDRNGKEIQETILQ